MKLAVKETAKRNTLRTLKKKHIVKSGGSIMETIKWENANALEIGMLMEMAEDGYVFCIEDGKIQAVEVRIFS